jgi:hypothetical protein
MELDDGSASLIAISYLPIGRKAPRGNGWLRAGGEHTLNTVMTRFSTKTHIADGSNLLATKGRIFCVEIDNQLPHIWRKAARSL